MESLPEEVLANIPTLFDYYVTTVTLVMFYFINVLFKPYRCPSCDTFSNRAPNLERHLPTCSERVEHVYPKNVYQLHDTLFDKLESFGNPNRDNQKLFNNLAIFEFESICVEDECLNDTEIATWIGKHTPVSASISSNLMQETNFFCDTNPRDLVSSFIEALEKLAT